VGEHIIVFLLLAEFTGQSAYCTQIGSRRELSLALLVHSVKPHMGFCPASHAWFSLCVYIVFTSIEVPRRL
jgi:hypothetical protein